jgi:hypothetical protein
VHLPGRISAPVVEMARKSVRKWIEKAPARRYSAVDYVGVNCLNSDPASSYIPQQLMPDHPFLIALLG